MTTAPQARPPGAPGLAVMVADPTLLDRALRAALLERVLSLAVRTRGSADVADATLDVDRVEARVFAAP
jgi:hypothetical protein